MHWWFILYWAVPYHTIPYSTVLYCTISYYWITLNTFLHTCFLLLNESILIRNEFIPIWYEFILSQCMYFTKSVLEQLRITLDKKFFWGLIVIKKCDFLKLFLHLNSEVWDAIWVWIHSNVEGIHSSFPWIHSLVKEFRLRQVFPYCYSYSKCKNQYKSEFTPLCLVMEDGLIEALWI